MRRSLLRLLAAVLLKRTPALLRLATSKTGALHTLVVGDSLVSVWASGPQEGLPPNLPPLTATKLNNPPELPQVTLARYHRIRSFLALAMR